MSRSSESSQSGTIECQHPPDENQIRSRTIRRFSRVWNGESERRFMELWHEVKLSSQGEMMTNVEKYKTVAPKLNVFMGERGWPSVSVDQVKNKVDTLVAKKKKVYEIFRRKSSTGSAVDDELDLEVSTL